MKSALYARVSTTKPEQDHALESQIDSTTRFLNEKGYEVHRIYQDRISGRRADRPGLREMRHDAALHRFQAVGVSRLDRLTRGGIRDMFDTVSDLEGHGAPVWSVSEGWWSPDNPAHDLVLAAIAWAARFESTAIGERVASGIAFKKKEAEESGEPWTWGKRSLVSKDPTLPARASALRQAGSSWGRIASELGVGRTTAKRLCQLAQRKPMEGDRAGTVQPD